jgi:hypothetical protein
MINGNIYGVEGGPWPQRGSLQCLDAKTGEFLFPTPFVFPEVSELLAEGSMKKSLKKVINECKKNSEFVITHRQPPWICGFVNLFILYPQEVVNLSIH